MNSKFHGEFFFPECFTLEADLSDEINLSIRFHGMGLSNLLFSREIDGEKPSISSDGMG